VATAFRLAPNTLTFHFVRLRHANLPQPTGLYFTLLATAPAALSSSQTSPRMTTPRGRIARDLRYDGVFFTGVSALFRSDQIIAPSRPPL
jgi:hypothetical protein